MDEVKSNYEKFMKQQADALSEFIMAQENMMYGPAYKQNILGEIKWGGGPADSDCKFEWPKKEDLDELDVKNPDNFTLTEVKYMADQGGRGDLCGLQLIFKDGIESPVY